MRAAQLRAELLRFHRELDDHLEHAEDEFGVVRLGAQHGDEVRLQRAPQPEARCVGIERVVTPHVPLKVAHALLDAPPTQYSVPPPSTAATCPCPR